METALAHYLQQHRIHYIEHVHGSVFTVEESGRNEIIKRIPGLHCKTLFLKDDLGRFYLVGMPAHERLDIKKLEQHLRVKKLRFGSAEELTAQVHLAPGSVSILGIIHSSAVRLVITQSVWDADIVGFHPNDNRSTLEPRHDDLLRFYDSLSNEKEIADI